MELIYKKISSIADSGEYQEDKFNEYNEAFKEKISDDLNTSNALTVLYDVLKDNSLTDNTKRKLIESFDKVLSLNLLSGEFNEIDSDLEKYILEKIEERNIAKKNKDYELADSIRNELLDKGISIIDTRDGTKYEVNR